MISRPARHSKFESPDYDFGVAPRRPFRGLLTPNGARRIYNIMVTLFDQAQSAVAALPRQERARLFVWLAKDFAEQLAGIESDPRVCGGSARIAGTRIPVWSLESWRRLGAGDEEILRNYPSLKPSDLLNAWQYVAQHPQEIDLEISGNETGD